MRKSACLTACLAGILLSFALHAQESPLDSAVTAALDSRLEEYFTALEPEPVSVKIRECDFMLDACDDPQVRQYVAMRIYDHFLGSNVMGDEGVAVHMVDEWFIPGKVSMYSDIDLLNAKVYAQFHRSSLIGMQAPPMTMRTHDGRSETAPQEGSVSVLFFYDTSCAKCKLENLKLRSFLPEVDVPVEFYAIYSGVYKDQWDEFVATRWAFDAPNVNVHHLWDPELESDFQMLYGVLQTPQMLLVDPDGVIVGRGLDTEALQKLLPTVSASQFRYGDPASTSLYEAVFEGDTPTAAGLLEIADYIRVSAESKGDEELLRHMLGDYFYYLMDTPGEEYKIALGAFIGTYIDGMPELWTRPAEVSQIVRPAEVAKDLLSRCPVGSRLPKIKVRGTLYGSDALRTWRLRRLKGSPSYVMFVDSDCYACQAEKSAVSGVIEAEPGARVLLVDPADNSEEIFDRFDLSVLPLIIRTDRKGTVTGKYISFL